MSEEGGLVGGIGMHVGRLVVYARALINYATLTLNCPLASFFPKFIKLITKRYGNETVNLDLLVKKLVSKLDKSDAIPVKWRSSDV